MPVDLPDSVALLIDPVEKDIGEFTVHRSLPDKRRQRVGPFIFWDHFGPVVFPPGAGVDVRPHPHIGLATITYLFDGTIVHRDSLGYEQPITCGAVNWMTAGKGIVHSERSPEETRKSESHLHGLQAWIALPEELEETAPRFEHYPAADVPKLCLPGATAKIIAGEAWGSRSPVKTSSPTTYIEVELEEGGQFQTPGPIDEIAVYAVSGSITVDGFEIQPRQMAVLENRSSAIIEARSNAKVMLLGGATLEGERILWWNFVSSSRDRLDQAKKDWLERRFDDVPGESEFIPLPRK